MTILRLPHSAKLSLSGALDPRFSSFMRRKTGLSFSLRRIQTETASSAADIRKGMRQP